MKNGIGLALIGLCIATSAPAAEFKFAALGDVPYGPPAKAYPPFERLIAEINAKAPAFTLHIGDTKSGSTPCTDQMLLDQKRFMNAFETAVVYTPGDNEWTDCHRLKAGRFDPIERLSFIRRTYFDKPMSLGKSPIAVERQSDLMPAYTRHVENSRFSRDGVWFVLTHVVGSNNNNRTLANARLGNPPSAAAVVEFEARDKANAAWLEDGFDKAAAAGAAAVVVAIHANIFDIPGAGLGRQKCYTSSSAPASQPLVPNHVPTPLDCRKLENERSRRRRPGLGARGSRRRRGSRREL